MTGTKDYSKVSTLVVGAGPAGLACAIAMKKERPDAEICVVDKAASAGNHNLSGAVLEAGALDKLLDSAAAGWRKSEQAKNILAKRTEKNDILFLLGHKLSFNISFAVKIAKFLGLGFGQMHRRGDYIVSVSKLTKWLTQIATQSGVEVMHDFAAKDIIFDSASGRAKGVELVDQGLDKQGNKQPNYLPGETIMADFVVLAEGCDGLVSEKFIEKAGLKRKSNQLYSVGVKELVRVRQEQYEKFGDGRVVSTLGYPLWTPVLGPEMFGGGIVYAMGDNLLTVGVIVCLDWKYCDFNPQDALTHFKNHWFVRQFIEGGQVVEAGAKMIPEGGYYAIPRDPATGAIGKGNVLILGDGAGFVNMLKIKGLHNAIESGILAAKAIAKSWGASGDPAVQYTEMIRQSNVENEMLSARNFRQTVAKFGPLIGMPLSALGSLLPEFEIEKDHLTMSTSRYKYKGNREFDKDTFTAMAGTQHRQEQPSHLSILDSNICRNKCTPRFNCPCITFCPAGVYETVQNVVKPANPSNCLHCKTCQRKCPFDNIRWTTPEGGGGPNYKGM